MRAKPILPYVTTPGITMAYNRLREVATQPFDATTAATMIYGISGSGKTELFKKVGRDLSWSGHPSDYGEKIMGKPGYLEAGVDVYNPRQSELAVRLGLYDEDEKDPVAAEKFCALLRDRRRMSGREHYASGEIVWGWFQFIAGRLGLPRPDPMVCLPLWGITEEIRNRYPIVIEAMVKDRPAHLQEKILTVFGLERGRLHYFRGRHVADLLTKMPIVLIVDEADVLHEDSLHAIRQICDFSATPLVLGGTDRLRVRLLSHPVLRPLATRVGMRIDLGRVTLPDLRKSLPGMDDEIVLEVFRQGGECFRTICIVLGGLRKFQAANPKRRMTREMVQVVARRVLTAVGAKRPKARPIDEADLVFTDEDLGVDPSSEVRGAELPAAPPAVARAVRKAG